MNTPAANDAPFGEALARAVVDHLRASRYAGPLGALVRTHRDYTGHGLFHDRDTGSWFLARSQDGLPDPTPLLSFPDADRFTVWLARQSDASLSGHAANPDIEDAIGFARDPGNQRITRDLLLSDTA
ncbi:hypothetical protein GRI97_02010 [Altererythrobacter xixiisoli]|uniref:Uncharacterized protein n=1 Tax=Croceibacterium xixiisoli TaxID=1476466 RepID=A0A6I4TRJ8_9SPHN|nr:hypothetical protein [Croceibacterium xixiisoli]MXO97761.1 hypothetical protein [Croceibacterium xixiisoli]